MTSKTALHGRRPALLSHTAGQGPGPYFNQQAGVSGDREAGYRGADPLFPLAGRQFPLILVGFTIRSLGKEISEKALRTYTEHSIWYLTDSFGIKICESGVNLVGNMVGRGGVWKQLCLLRRCVSIAIPSPRTKNMILFLYSHNDILCF